MSVELMDPSQAFSLRDDLLNELRNYPDVDPDDPFVRGIPRVLGGMIKCGHVSMTYTAHRIRELARAKYFEVLQAIPDNDFQTYLRFERPRSPEELSCNPDGVFVSNGEPVKFPRSDVTDPDGCWWHIDASHKQSFLQAAVVLDNPDGSERFAVINKSHQHFELLKSRAGARMAGDWFLLNADEIAELESLGCSRQYLQFQPGTLVVWFGTLVHTVAPAQLDIMKSPRVQTYVCFAVPEFVEVATKVSVILFGATCRHLPFPCRPEWQMHIFPRQFEMPPHYRDIVFPHEWLPWVFGANPEQDFTNERLSIYGVTPEQMRETVENWDPEYESFLSLFH
jgi:hypothetical protein